ncbi:hypothetical protein HYU45_04220 [Candidatus Daviesbacteria bacterium]|nr:hypothetical protein [Candidatus Daviesbacteria bacterium]
MREFLDNLRNSEFFQNKRNLIILAVLVLTLPVGIFLITQQQIFKSRAAGEPIEFSGNNVERRGNSWVALRADQPITLKLTSRLGSGNTPTPTPPASVPSTPTNPSASCPDPGTAAKFSWTGVSGATRYDLYVHNTADPALVWGSTESGGNACTPPNFCEPLTSTSKSLTGRIPGATYQWFVFACNASGCSTGAAEGSFTCTRQVAPATPTVSFTASPTTITAGQSTTLTWSSTNAVKCILNPPGVFKTVDASGSDTFSPTETTTYNMRCEGVGGAANSARVSVAVTVNPPLPCTPEPCIMKLMVQGLNLLQLMADTGISGVQPAADGLHWRKAVIT